ncbi:MAG TPA: hypothetical protein VFY13_00750 [Luteolibacter sp.]|nr:hypothetical protein [Luteolibacter sp.]
MSNATTDNLDPDAGFSNTPTISQAAHDLRVATSAKAKELIHNAEVKANEFRQTAATKANEFRSTATRQVSHLKEVAGEQWDTTRAKAKEIHGTAEDYIREHPTRCVLAALGIGFLAGLIMRR